MAFSSTVRNHAFATHVVTDADKELYITDYFEKKGIKINFNKISLNPHVVY